MKQRLADLLDKIGQENTKFYHGHRLEYLTALAGKANLLTIDIPIISVTGTNGKGSTVRALASIYEHAGYRAGVFTSPHLERVNERIAVNQTLISDEGLIEALLFVHDLDVEARLSFFETITLAALYHFRSQQVDVVLLEVGLGGRLDAINILDADLVIMTSVDLDHQALLGDTIDAIAIEKAGLLRPHAQLIFADNACPLPVFSVVEEQEIDFQLLGRDYHIEAAGSAWSLRWKDQIFTFSRLPQLNIQAMAAAMMATEMLKACLPFSYAAWERANALAFLPGRLQRLEGDVPIVLDVAHNPHATSLLYSYLSQQNIKGRIHAVCAMLSDKDGKKIVEIINNLSPLWYTCILDSERSHTPQRLLDLFASQGVNPYLGKHPLDAFQRANHCANPNDLIVVFGSFLVVGPIIQYLHKEFADVV